MMKSRIIRFLKHSCLFFIIPFSLLIQSEIAFSQSDAQKDEYRMDNPITVEYLETHLKKSMPRLVLNSEIEEQLKRKLKTDPVVQNMYEAIKLNAGKILTQPMLQREVVGRRLLATSRELLYRMNILGMVYRIENDPQILERINEELITVCNFQDWNPSHYLDVAEMAMGVAIGLDWTGEDLPESTVELAKTCLIEKGIKPSYSEDENIYTDWITADFNWNQVCNGGMVAAAIAIAEKDPALAAKTLSRSLDGIPNALEVYGPDGVYPEGPTYWNYGTSYSVMTSSILESAFGTDFGLTGYPGFMESADFRLITVAPSGWYFNYGDSGDKRSENGDLTLAWFAAKTGNNIYFEKERFLRNPVEIGELDELVGAGLVWLSQYEDQNGKRLPLAWKGEGENPIVVFRGGEDDPHQYYFAGKGGRGDVGHSNMDPGSFIFELNGVRWVVDPGNQNYHELEQAGFDLWRSCQECQRWTLLTKNNFGHSTLTVNNSFHNVDGFAPIIHFTEGEHPEVIFDLSEVFEGQLKSAHRRFKKESAHSMLIEDKLEPLDSTELITWQLITTADVYPDEDGAILKKNGKELNLEILSPSGIHVSVVSLDPPPMKLDKRIEGLKRIEIRMPAWIFDGQEGQVSVRLTGS